MSKPVSMIELFYDLVFVYMISKATGLLHQLDHGVIAPLALGVFAFVVIVFINSWMVQTVFVNRFGASSWTDIGFMFGDMMIVLYMANSFSGALNANLRPFFIAAGLLSLTLCIQYVLVWQRTANRDDRAIAQAFSGILGVRTLSLLGAGFLPLHAGLWLAAIGVLVSWVAPAFTGKLTSTHPIIFSHLLERVTELSIVLFGETIVGIAGYFTRQTFSVVSVLIFLIVASLFFAYIAVFDHLVDEKKAGETGNLLIYLHYPIIFGISMVTVALRDITAPAVNRGFAITFLYAGIGLMYLGLWLARHYQQARYQTNQISYAVIAGLLVVAYSLTLLLAQPLATVVVTVVATLAAAALLVRQIDPAGHQAA